MTTETHLNRQRGAIKSKLTNFSNFLKSIQNLVDKNESISEQLLLELQIKTDKISNLDEEFDSIQRDIEYLTEDSKIDEQYNIRNDFENTLTSCLASAKLILNKQYGVSNVKSRKGSLDNLSISSQQSSHSKHSKLNEAISLENGANLHQIKCSNTNLQEPCLTGNSKMQNIKLPTIELPKFEGSHSNWLGFKDSFESLIHSNSSINAIQKYHYLRASLSDEASRIIQSLEFSSENYEFAWQLLCKRFDNSHLLIHHHIKSIFEMEPLIKESSSGIRSLIDTLSKHIRALETLKQPTIQWDALLIFILTSKLDKSTAREWEKEKLSYSNYPTLSDMNKFLTLRSDWLETLESNHSAKVSKEQKTLAGKNKQISLLAARSKCFNCKGTHRIYSCNTFLKLSIPQRSQRVKELKLCQNCLCLGHANEQCKAGACKKCGKKHNTLLHCEQPENEEFVSLSCYSSHSLVLLSTAVVTVRDSNGVLHKVKALLDNGSQPCFISKQLCQRLQLPQFDTHIPVIGINKSTSQPRSWCEVSIGSPHNRFSDTIECLVLPEITENIPACKIDTSHWKIPKGIKLADPEFNIPSKVDLLLGAGLFWDLITNERIILGDQLPILIGSVFGYIVSGTLNIPITRTQCNFSKLSNDIKRFWEIEEIEVSPKALSADDFECENHFINTVSRTIDGRFLVKIPLKYHPSKLGDSKNMAIKRLLQVERRLQSDNELRCDFNKFMKEYEELGHMSLCTEEGNYTSCFLPFHGVVKKDSLTTKLRIVFDGSAPTTSGWSLNELQYTGPSILNNLFDILIRFRQHRFVVCADVEKMYRQILIHSEDRHLQKIVWRYSPDDDISIYNLNTVTYGTSSAPYLAIRCLRQLAFESNKDYPKASKIIQHDFYVDDLISGFDSEEDGAVITEQIYSILYSAKFVLRKWCSNSAKILDRFKDDNHDNKIINLGDNEFIKTLGLRWLTNADMLTFQVNDTVNHTLATKRNILSEISKIFDPLGLVSPCIILCKYIIQRLWELKVDWDHPVPSVLENKWLKLKGQLPLLNKLQLRRHAICSNPAFVELHGFCDASQQGYGACIYLRSVDQHQNIYVHLLCAKTKVAPLKPLTIPRLELCSALMLACLMNQVRQALTLNLECHLWSDSQIVLSWIKTEPKLLQTFVCNRIAQIQSLCSYSDWNYISTKENPADIASRGTSPDLLITSQLWWHGPSWLSLPKSNWNNPVTDVPYTDLPEMKKQHHCFTCVDNYPIKFEAYSSLIKLKHVIAYCLRFIHNCRQVKGHKLTGPITVEESAKSMKLLVSWAQSHCFSKELDTLKANKQLNNRNRILGLSPFIDQDGLIRVGGRLKYSNLPFNSKHPLLLSGKHYFTKLVFENYHKRHCHAPPQLLLSLIRQEYWPTSGMSVAKTIVHNCIRCFKFKPKPFNQIMADLPKDRTTIIPPFSITGVDYAGPFTLKDKKGRGCKLVKCYVCLFVCFASKAIHLELVTDLTSQCFIAALRRFSSRRGKPSKIYSDNGTNFVGARKELQNLYKFLSESNNDIIRSCADEGIIWNFIPPNSPHFGCLWEAAVKSTKYHLLRVLGDTQLIFEEFYTILVQIEAILNSRPMYSMSQNPNDLQPLTPSHLLIGRPLVSLPDPNLLDIPIGRLSRYQLLQRLNQNFWQRWSREYLSSLQQRNKWKSRSENPQLGTLVIIKNDNSPPCSWQIGRVIQLHPDGDGIVRVASVKTSRGIYKRAIVRLCPLPIHNDEATPFNKTIEET